MKIKVIALDIYGTVLCSDDPENAMPPRRGFAEFVRRAKEAGIKLVTSSDANLDLLKLDLQETMRGRTPFGLEIFDGFYYLSMRPKKYWQIINDFKIKPEELMIIGDNRINDFGGAPNTINCLVPKYDGVIDQFDFSEIAIV